MKPLQCRGFFVSVEKPEIQLEAEVCTNEVDVVVELATNTYAHTFDVCSAKICILIEDIDNGLAPISAGTNRVAVLFAYR